MNTILRESEIVSLNNRYIESGRTGPACPGCAGYLQNNHVVHHSVGCEHPTSCWSCGSHKFCPTTALPVHQPRCRFASVTTRMCNVVINPSYNDVMSIFIDKFRLVTPVIIIDAMGDTCLPIEILHKVMDFLHFDTYVCKTCNLSSSTLTTTMIRVCVPVDNLEMNRCITCLGSYVRRVMNIGQSYIDEWVLPYAVQLLDDQQRVHDNGT